MSSTIKLSDYVMRFLAEQGVTHVYMLSGGGAMHLDDSLGGCTALRYVCNLHEQACAIAAEAHARVTNHLSAVLVTTGPGGTNTVTGVAAAWLDSTPVLFISGQVKRADLKTQFRRPHSRCSGNRHRLDCRLHHQIRCHHRGSAEYSLSSRESCPLALSGRRGPVWIDIPLDVQAAQIDPGSLPAFIAEEPPAQPNAASLPAQVAQAVELLRAAQRPVLLAGNGIRMAGAAEEFIPLIERLGIPVLTTWLGLDLITEDHPLCFGRPGSLAPRGANFTLQNCDLLLIVGSRLDMAMTAYAHDRLARGAKKIMVDIDEAEIRKMQTPIHLPIVADAKAFLTEFSQQSAGIDPRAWQDWVDRCRAWKAKYPLVRPEHRSLPDALSMYHFSEVLAEEMGEGDVIVPGSSGFAVEIFLLCLKIKRGQRCFHNRGTGSMGFGLPASIGAAVASEHRTICVDGDGGFQMNIHELATVERLHLPIKFFVANNNGYASIRASQSGYFHRLVGADPTSGVTLPDLEKVAHSYGLPFRRIADRANLADSIRDVLSSDGPVVCEVMIASAEERVPRASSFIRQDGSMGSKPLEDLFPFLPRDVFRAEMIIPLQEDE